MIDESLGATWGKPVAAEVFAEAESVLDGRIPVAWRAFLTRDRWLRKGWLLSGAYVQLYAPDEAMRWMEAWRPALELHPGFYLLGDDGSREMYCIDLNNPANHVMSADIVSSGWGDTESLGLSMIEFIRSIDNGTFDPLAEG